MKPLLSICIPTFNRYKELKRLINSIDKNKNIELVILDDGSKDETSNIFSEFKNKFNIRPSYIFHNEKSSYFIYTRFYL